MPVAAPVRLIVTFCGAVPLTVPEMLKVEVVAEEAVDDVPLPQGETSGPPKVLHPEPPHPETRTAIKNGNAVRIVFMRLKKVSISPPLVHVLTNRMLP